MFNRIINSEQIHSFGKLAEDIPDSVPYCFSLDRISKKFDNVTSLYWEDGLKALKLV